MKSFEAITLLFLAENLTILVLFYMAFFYRKNLKKHKRYNFMAVFWDILLILQIELARGAIDAAINHTENSSLLNFHISIAVLVVMLYPVAIISGFMQVKRNRVLLSHRLIGRTILLLRTMVFVTSVLIKL